MNSRAVGPLLALESSCDETAVAILDAAGAVLANVVHTQIAVHARFGGVVPEIASREHIARIAGLVTQALDDAKLQPSDLRAVAATYGPGLIGALLVGLQTGKGLAQGLGVPFVGVHHIEGHLMAQAVDPLAPRPPFIGLVVSGGHTALYRFEGVGQATLLGQTLDDAAGEAFDKSAKLLGLGYPGGAVIDRLADEGDDARFKLPVSLKDKNSFDFSFSGLKTAVRLLVEKLMREQGGRLDDQTLRDVCACVRRAIVTPLVDKAMRACRRKQVPVLVVGGGVAANGLLRRALEAAGVENDVKVYVPPRALCTDNAVMIAAAARAWLLQNQHSALSLAAQPDALIEQSAHALLAST